MWLIIFYGHLRLINCFKVVSKTQRLRVKDKPSDIFRLLFCLSGEITAHLFRICPHANSYTTNVAKSQPWQNTEFVMLLHK